ncbi:hypothetical protein [Stenotrophomonas phage RAS14]
MKTNLLKTYYPQGASKETVLMHEAQILHKAWRDRFTRDVTTNSDFLLNVLEAKSVLLQMDLCPDYLSD